VRTRDLGEVEVAPERVFEFVSPLLGFEAYRRFAIVPMPNAAPFHSLQSLEERGLAFPLVSAEEFAVVFAGPTDDLAPLGADSWKDVECWIIVGIPGEGAPLRPNLKAPVVVCPKTGRAAQLVLVEREESK